MKITRNGFTLIEVLVALAILAISLGTIMAGLTIQSRRIAGVEQQSEALQIATSLLASAGVALPLRPGETAGTAADGFTWQIQISPWGSDEDRKARSIPAYNIKVMVTKQGRMVALSTLRAGA